MYDLAQEPQTQAAQFNEAGVRVEGAKIVVAGRVYAARAVGGVEFGKPTGDLRADVRRIAGEAGTVLFFYWAFGAFGALGSLMGAALLEGFKVGMQSNKLMLTILVHGQRVDLVQVLDMAQGNRIGNAILRAAEEAG